VPSVEDGAAYAADLLGSNFTFGRAKGLQGRRLLKFAVSAYNAGAGGAWKGVREHGDSDALTTGKNYGADVLRRMAILRGWLGADEAGPSPRPVLRHGDVGPDVLELKRRLRAWFQIHRPGSVPEFKLNTSYGPAFVSAVEVFQRINRLDVDGVAGPQVWGVLDRG
jgi:peptidoglycan hydrolase-like protein with peptidoglycan-binding domain